MTLKHSPDSQRVHRTLSKSVIKTKKTQNIPAFLPNGNLLECQPRSGDAPDQEVSPKKCHCTIYMLKHFKMILSAGPEGPEEQLQDKSTTPLQAGWHFTSI